MPDLHAAIRERLETYVDEGCGYSGHDCRVTGHDEMKAALLAVLAEHEHVPADGGERTEHDFGCRTCHSDSRCGTTDGHGWCDTVRQIAEKLGAGT